MNLIEIENQFYILATSSMADNRTMVLKHGESFGVFDRHGDIHQIGKGLNGVYHEGTRFLSKMELTIENERPLLLTSAIDENNQVLNVDLTNPDLTLENNEVIMRGSVHMFREKIIWESVCYEKIRFFNFGLNPVDFSIEIAFGSDCSDIFEVRGSHRANRGICYKGEAETNRIVLVYKGLDEIIRRSIITVSPNPEKIKDDTCYYRIFLLPKQEITINVNVAFATGNKEPKILKFERAIKESRNYAKRITNYSSDIYSSSEKFNSWINRSRSDMITMVTQTEYGPYPYAGIPWYSTPFGRDGIITALECLWLEPDIANGVLKYVAATQSKVLNDFSDAEPGKIFHEKRGGEMAMLGEIPFKMYYGSIDATPLFIVLAGLYLERTDDVELIRQIWPNILDALDWIEKYGDLDGDGYVEYATKSEKGLINQGWKDSHDSVFYSNGKMAVGPIALCEVQGYVYDAKMKAAYMAGRIGQHDIEKELESQAFLLKEKFIKDFWSEDQSAFVLALDGKKNKCDVLTSNSGHCLFSGIATNEQALKIANALLGEKMFTGWGIRTLASDEVQYNPMSYHNGSIWPHDNALIAYGFCKYGLKNEVLKVFTALFELAMNEDEQRLPELICGFPKRKGVGPTAYPVACSPQAWAVAAVYYVLQAALGLHIDAQHNKLIFKNPVLPSFLNEITIRNLRIKDQSISIQIRKIDEGISVTSLDKDSKIQIIVEERQQVVIIGV